MRTRMVFLSGCILVLFMNACEADLPTPPPEVALPTAPTASPVFGQGTPEAELVPAGNGPNICYIHMINELHGWAVTCDQQLLRTRDGGIDWEAVSPDDGSGAAISVDYLSSLFLDAEHAWLLNWGNGLSLEEGGLLLRTRDGGKSWQSFDVPFVAGSLFFLDQDLGWMMALRAMTAEAYTVDVYRTEDGGETWETLLSDSQASLEGEVFLQGGQIAFRDKLNGWDGCISFTPNNLCLFRTKDSGITWQAQALDTPIASQKARTFAPLFFSHQEAVLAVLLDSATLVTYTSTDGGETWQVSPGIVEESEMVDFVSPQAGFARCGNNLCVTLDAGKDWSVVEADLGIIGNPNWEMIHQFDFVDPLTGWAVVYRGDDRYSLLETVDGGRGWRALIP